MRQDEKPLDYFLRMLIEGQIRFSDLVSMYVSYLERWGKDNREQIVESAVLLSMYEKSKLNLGTKKQLQDRTRVAIEKSGIFPTLLEAKK